MGIRLKLLVACLAALFLAQVGWWGYTIWNQGESKREATLVGLETRKEAAHATWEAAGGTARSWESIAVRFSGITLIEVDGQPRLKIEEAKLSSLARDRDGMRRMLFAEGGFFLLLAIGFLLLLFRAIQMEARLSREHTRFLHTVTHELRTPLQALKLASETLALENSPEKTREYAEGMLQDTHRLEALVDRVLVAGRLEAGTPSEGDLALIRRSVEALQQARRARVFTPLGRSDRFPEDLREEAVLRLRRQTFRLLEEALAQTPTASAGASD